MGVSSAVGLLDEAAGGGAGTGTVTVVALGIPGITMVVQPGASVNPGPSRLTGGEGKNMGGDAVVGGDEGIDGASEMLAEGGGGSAEIVAVGREEEIGMTGRVSEVAAEDGSGMLADGGDGGLGTAVDGAAVECSEELAGGCGGVTLVAAAVEDG